MPTKKFIQPGEKVPLKLSATERTLILEGLLCLDQQYEDVIRATPSGKPVAMSLDDLEDFGGYIAAEANHCADRRKQDRLDAIFERIQALLDAYTEAQPPTTFRIEDARPSTLASKQSVQITKADPKTKTTTLFQFKITLLDSKPPIWRRVQVADCTLAEFHDVIQVAMGWQDCHLHQFIINGERYGPPTPDDFELEMENEEKVRLSQIVSETGKQFRFKYEYDFGDSWLHEIVFEGHPSVEKGAKYPLCLEGARACPPEDVGGVFGYVEFLEAILNPKHEQHDDMLEWIGGDYDPEEFDAKQVSKALRRSR